MSVAKRDGRSREQLAAEVEFWKRGGWAHQFGPSVRTLCWAVSIYFIFQTLGQSAVHIAAHLAGKNTDANIVMKLLGAVSTQFSVSLMCGLGGLGYGFLERQQRKKTTERLSSRITELELLLDQKRTSSGLTPSGGTNPRDKL